MQRTPQRSYSAQSLEAWFERLANDWESRFGADELQWGRAFYRCEEVRSTELLEQSAIIHFRSGKDPFYVIIDWADGGPVFRYSHPERSGGNGMGIAGLYEVEELVADEIPPVPPQAMRENKESTRERRIDLPEPPPRGRPLHVRLRAQRDGLRLEAGYAKADTNAVDWGRFSLSRLSSWEREQLIGFTALAHRGGFQQAGCEGIYHLAEPEAVARFFAAQLSDWRRQFVLEVDPALKPWSTGLQRLRPTVQLQQTAAGHRFQIRFYGINGPLPDCLTHDLLGNLQRTHFIPGAGIFELDPEAREAIQEWRAWLGHAASGEIPTHLAFALAQEPGFELDAASSLDTWLAQLQVAEADNNLPALPDFLRPYQAAGIRWIHQLVRASCHGLLADEMGLGKTVQVLGYLQVTGALRDSAVLVVCPASVVPVWQAEVKRFFGDIRIQVLGGKRLPLPGESGFWLASYTQVRRHKSHLENCPFRFLILDEAQNIKNPDAKVTHACLALQAQHRLALTGTPMENRPLDLWTLFRFLMPGYLGSRRRFEQARISRPDFSTRLRTLMQPFVLRRLKSAVGKDLPPKIDIPLPCPLTAAQRHQYQALLDAGSGTLAAGTGARQGQRSIHLLSLLTRLRQACCDPALLPGYHGPWDHSGKLQILHQQLESAVAGGSKIVIFSQFVRFLDRARAMVSATYPTVTQFVLTGATRDRARPVAAFAAHSGPAIFFISLKAGGTGLNLQTADYVFLLDPWWNPAVEAQAVDRVHRIGQQNHVFVYRLIASGTIEQRVEQLKHTKAEWFSELVSESAIAANLLDHFSDLQQWLALDNEED